MAAEDTEAGAAGLTRSQDRAPGHGCREEAAGRPSNPSRDVHLKREAGGEHPSETLTTAVLGLHRVQGEQARAGFGGSARPQSWWARLQRPDLCPAPRGLSPTAPQSPEQVQQYLLDLSTYHFPKIHSCPSLVPIQEAAQT